MPKITLDQFCKQWTRGRDVRDWHSLLAKNAEDFVTRAGKYAVDCFKSSFAEGGFYGSGTKWAPRTSEWGKKYTHPVLIDSKELKSKITGELRKLGSYSTFGKRDYRRRYHYDISTKEESKTNDGHRGKKNGNYKNYAAVHNTNPKFGLYTVRKNSLKRPVHRQFIGHSPKLLDEINKLYVPQIFNGFPI